MPSTCIIMKIQEMWEKDAQEKGYTQEQIEEGKGIVIELYREDPGILGTDTYQVQLPDGQVVEMTPAQVEEYQGQLEILAKEQAKNGKNGKPPPEWLPALVISGGVILVAVSVAVALRGKKK